MVHRVWGGMGEGVSGRIGLSWGNTSAISGPPSPLRNQVRRSPLHGDFTKGVSESYSGFPSLVIRVDCLLVDPETLPLTRWTPVCPRV